MSSREAERKALQRAGYAHWQIPVRPQTLIAALLAEGLITDAQIENMDALREAVGRFLMRHCSIGRLRRDSKEQRERRPEKRTKAKRPDKPKHGSVRHWTPEEIEAWEPTPGALQGDDVQFEYLEYYEDGYPKLPACLDRRRKPEPLAEAA